MASSYKSSTSLQAPIPSVSSVTLGVEGTSDPNEARYWTQKFGLGTTYGSSTSNKFSHPRILNFKTPSKNAIVSQVLFGPPVLTKNSPLAVVSGPRVTLYGSSATTSSFSRALARHSPTLSSSPFGEQQQQQDEQKLHDIAPDRQVGTGGNPALCAAFRTDGRLLAVGTDRGEVRVCDSTSRATLCTFQQNKGSSAPLAVRAVAWMRSGKQLLSGGDDGLLRVWSLSQAASQANQAVLTLRGHGDAVRSIVLWQPGTAKTNNSSSDDNSMPWKSLAMTGSYDHTIRVWNLDNIQDDASKRNKNKQGGDARCLSILSHGEPVEALLLMPSSDSESDSSSPPWLLSAGGNTIKVWNPLTGVCVSEVPTQHSKTITSLIAMKRTQGQDHKETDSWRIMTAGLDGLVRIHTWSATDGKLAHVHGVKLSQPVTSMAVSENSERLVIGTTTGHVLVRQRGPSISPSKRKREPKAGTFSYFTRGTNVAPDVGDYVALQERKRKLKSFDVALKQFRYGDALDEALDTRQPQAVRFFVNNVYDATGNIQKD